MVSRATARLIEALLLRHADEIAPEIDLHAAAMLIETTLEAIAHGVRLAVPTTVSDDVLAQEASRMVLR